MRMRRVFVMTVLAIVGAALPVSIDAPGANRLGLATASCQESDCGRDAKMDCVCPDEEAYNRKPRCAV